MNVIIGIVVLVIVVAVIVWACAGNKCIGCNEPVVMCKSCKNYEPPLIASNYEPIEEDMKEIDFLSQRINALTDEEFLQLSKLVARGYDNGRD